MKFVLTIVFIIFGVNSISAQVDFDYAISFSELEILHRAEPKPVVVFIHTSWCKFCLGMKKRTFTDEGLSEILKNDYYFVVLDGEEKNDIRFLNHTFKFIPNGNQTGVHELARELGSIGGKLSYPTTVFLNKLFEIEFQYDQFLSAKDLKKVLLKKVGNK